ncbi:COR domain-containing protein [Micromonospora sp. NPDC048999]|uniref:COR domain-containing protein n=1 Tax=Micromonospora sp. NPDC048999 TaxID=3155391 RepID=UPI003407B1BB
MGEPLMTNRLDSDEIRHARRTGFLNLAGRDLRELPFKARDIPNLAVLVLSHNAFEHIPTEVFRLTKLERLDMRSNRLTYVPGALEALRNLKELDLSANRIISLPPEMAILLRQGTLVDVELNPLAAPLPELLQRRSSKDLAAYLESLREGIPQYEAKVMLLGEGNVGKTSLAAVLRGERFVHNRATTHGIEIRTLKVRHPKQDLQLTLRTWDFGGQEVYRITHQFFFGRRALYLVVWNAREGQEQNEVEGWIRRICLRVGKDASTLLVATHSAERHPELDYPKLRAMFPEMLQGNYAVDSYTFEGVSALRKAIAAEAARLPQMGLAMNSRWIAARDEILSMAQREPQITFEEYAEVCEINGLSADQANTLAELLHDLGLIVYYGDDLGLRDVVVLNPEWLTKAIGYVLEDRITREQHGVLEHRRLKEIWLNGPDGGSYPTKYHPYFLRLMEKFDVSYRLADEDSSLVAQLVPHERPTLKWQHLTPLAESLRKLSLICELSDPVPGVIAWLTVRHHRFSIGKHWRSGVFLRHNIEEYDAEALIELQSERQLAIEVRAPSPDLLFNVIRDSVEDLLTRRWPGLEYRLKVPCPTVGPDGPCGNSFPLEGLIRLRERNRRECDCLECDAEHDVSTLLTGFAPPGVSDEIEQIQEQLADVAEDIKQLERIALESAGSLRRVIKAVNTEVADCPRLFTLRQASPTGLNKLNFWNDTYRLTLWCEHAAQWHICPDAGYTMQQSRKWLVQVAPYLNLIAKTLCLVVPVAGAAAGATWNEQLSSQAQKDLELMKALTDQLPTDIRLEQDAPTSEASGQLTPAQGAALRNFRYWLLKTDPQQGFGGLRRVQAPSGELLWVCPAHYPEYDPGLPILP